METTVSTTTCSHARRSCWMTRANKEPICKKAWKKARRWGWKSNFVLERTRKPIYNLNRKKIDVRHYWLLSRLDGDFGWIPRDVKSANRWPTKVSTRALQDSLCVFCWLLVSLRRNVDTYANGHFITRRLVPDQNQFVGGTHLVLFLPNATLFFGISSVF